MKATSPKSFAIVLPLAVMFLLAACEAPKREADYRNQHKIKVVVETVAMELADFPSFSAMPKDSQEVFNGFTREYQMRAIGAATIDASATGGEGARLARIERVRTMLRASGVPAADINVKLGGARTDGPPLVISFTAHAAQAPECGDFSSGASFNWSNRSQSNYGCSIQRNLSLTVADPGDLNKAHSMSGSDGGATVNVVRSYRAPAAAGAGTGTAATGAATGAAAKSSGYGAK